MVAVRFFNLEYDPIEFLTDRVRDSLSSNFNFPTVSNTLDGNTCVRATMRVFTTGIGRVGEVLSALDTLSENRSSKCPNDCFRGLL